MFVVLMREKFIVLFDVVFNDVLCGNFSFHYYYFLVGWWLVLFYCHQSISKEINLIKVIIFLKLMQQSKSEGDLLKEFALKTIHVCKCFL